MSTPCSNRKAPCSNEHGAFFGALRGSALASPVLTKVNRARISAPLCSAMRMECASRLPCIAERFWQTLAENPMRRHATIKMCRDPRHTFIFHVPEGRASYAEGVLHVPQARFICGAKAPQGALYSH